MDLTDVTHSANATSTDPYPNKTDREQQWLAFVNECSFSRKVLKQWQHYFLTGKMKGKSEDLYSLLALHPEQTIESWQYVLDQHFLAKPDEWDGYNSDFDVNNTLFKDIHVRFLVCFLATIFIPKIGRGSFAKFTAMCMRSSDCSRCDCREAKLTSNSIHAG